jgi:ABC-type glycerol-3-phosphate transport system substrate-binding protein
MVAKEIEAKTGAKAFNLGANGAGGVFDAFARQDTTGNFDKEGNVLMDDAAHAAAAAAVKRIWDAQITTDLDGPVMWQAYKDKKLSMMRYPNWQDFVIMDSAPETKGMWRVCKLPMVADGGKRAHTDDGCCLCMLISSHLRRRSCPPRWPST